METTINGAGLDLLWWISVFELPALALLFCFVWKSHQIHENMIIKARWALDEGLRNLREALAAYKLEVAKNYASLSYLNAVEKRLTEHLLRIENKLDKSPENKARN